MTDVHDAAMRGYSAMAATYVSGRPGYPPELSDWLREVVGLGPGRKALDLGSGTGKFLPYLAATGGALVAVEPVPAMRAELTAAHPGIEALPGDAEHIPLPDASLDAVICAQSFHWFASPAALAEIARVLRPGGVLGLVWNVRDESVDWVAALSRITDPHAGDAPRYRTGQWRTLFPAKDFEAIGERHFRNDHLGTPEQVIVERTLSVSFIAALPPVERDAVAAEVRALIAATPVLAGPVAFPYETIAVAYRRAG